ncbi:MAG: GNAT family N-acetyltransferase [Austwickia sp.]|nr:GNAT family N-acetyltransferase [Austwickia sp.]
MNPFVGRGVRAVGEADRAAALDLCARDPLANCYVAARIAEVDLDRSRSLLGHYRGGRLEALCWATANVIPVECGPDAARAFAERLRRQQHQFSSIFGPALQVALLWEDLSQVWRRPLEVRARQPLLAIGPHDAIGVRADLRVRAAEPGELDQLVPAASAMFTEEIGYPPYGDRGSEIGYRNGVRGLIARHRAYVLIDEGRILFKADLGSVGVGAGQIQGVWVDPAYRGQGLAAPAMARAVELARREVDWVSLYVNDYNTAALRTYRRVGFTEVGLFATILF